MHFVNSRRALFLHNTTGRLLLEVQPPALGVFEIQDNSWRKTSGKLPESAAGVLKNDSTKNVLLGNSQKFSEQLTKFRTAFSEFFQCRCHVNETAMPRFPNGLECLTDFSFSLKLSKVRNKFRIDQKSHGKIKQETLRVVTIAMICSTLASL